MEEFFTAVEAHWVTSTLIALLIIVVSNNLGVRIYHNYHETDED